MRRPEVSGGLVAGGFAEGVAVVVAALELVGGGVDGDQFAVAPGAGGLFVELGLALGDVAGGLEGFDGGEGEGLFELEDVGEVLVVEAGGVGRGLDVEVVVEDAEEVVGDGGDDGGAAGGAKDQAEFAGGAGGGGGGNCRSLRCVIAAR